MAKVSLSNIDVSLESIWSWYEDQKTAIKDLRYKIIDSVITSSIVINDKFLNFTIDDLNTYFDKSEIELEHLVCFNLISATEGVLTKDYFNKVYEKDKSNLGRIFRRIHKEKGQKIKLEDDIISSWKEIYPSNKSNLSDYIGLLHYRHWLAHGRYWNLTSKGRQYSADETFGITEFIFDMVTK